MANMLDIFNNDAFSATTLTAGINTMAQPPSRALQYFTRVPLDTTKFAVSMYAGSLRVVQTTSRGGPGVTRTRDGRSMVQLETVRILERDAVMASEIQNRVAMGSTVLEGVAAVVARKQMALNGDVSLTEEHMALGALRGIVLDADGSVLLDCFDKWNIARPAPIDFNLSATSPSRGSLNDACTNISIAISDNLQNVPFSGVKAFVGNNFARRFMSSAEYLRTMDGTLNQIKLANPNTGNGLSFYYGGISFEVNSTEILGLGGVDPVTGLPIAGKLVGDDEAMFFPMGVQGLFNLYMSPMDTLDHVNTEALPRYSQSYPIEGNRGLAVEVEADFLPVCTRPSVLFSGITG